jgi:hypothetical protein
MKQKLFASVPRYLVLCGCSFVVVFAAIAVLQAVLEVFAWGSVALVIWLSLSYTHFALAQEDQERLERYFLGWFWNF